MARASTGGENGRLVDLASTLQRHCNDNALIVAWIAEHGVTRCPPMIAAGAYPPRESDLYGLIGQHLGERVGHG